MPTSRPIVHAKTEGVERVESGPVQFGEDWPGLFLRGDHAIKVAQCIRQLQAEVVGSPTARGLALKFLAELAVIIENDVDKRHSSSA